MSESRDFDIVVLGAGPAGEVAAGRLADAGLEVAIVEADLVGGECAFYACMPSKALLRPAQALAEARRVAGAAQAASGELDVAAVLERRDEIVHGLDDSSKLAWLQEHGIVLLREKGALTGEREVRAGEHALRARRAVVLAVGSRAAVPALPGLRELEPWTNREATTAHSVPRSLLVMGGGVVGVELAWAYASLGSSVTLLEAVERLLAREEEFASAQVLESLRGLGVRVELGVKAVRALREGDELALELEDGRRVSAASLLVAVGRRPRTEAIGLESIGLEPGGYLQTDAAMRVGGHEWLYAIGDANGRTLLTHMAKYQARIATDHILGRHTELRSDGPQSPRVVFTEPQVAAVGHTLASARAAGLRVRAVDTEVEANAGASFVGHGAPGTARLVIDEDRGLIAGATFTGVEVAEWLHAATIAVIGEVPLERLRHAIAAFPTRSEVWLKLLEGYYRS